MAKKICFVIMPFSATRSTSAKKWRYIYDKIIKLAVEDSGLDFVCKRSTAIRGNIVKDIINDLNQSDVVIADMTDHNPNVCYELGVRHGLNVGTILLAQKRKFLQIFDLNNYASHVYSWKTVRGRTEAIQQIRKLLTDYVQNPEKPDNPVKDFLQHSPSYKGASTKEFENIIEFDKNNTPNIVIPAKQITAIHAVGFLLLGSAENGLSLKELTQLVSKNWKKQSTGNVSSTIAKMKGWVIKEGEKRNYTYRLSGIGRQEILKLIKILKAK